MQFYLNCPIQGTTTSCILNCRCNYNHAARYQSKYSFTYSILFYMLAWQLLYLLCLWWLITLKIIHGLHHLSMFLLISRGFSGFVVFSCILLGSAFFYLIQNLQGYALLSIISRYLGLIRSKLKIDIYRMSVNCIELELRHSIGFLQGFNAVPAVWVHTVCHTSICAYQCTLI